MHVEIKVSELRRKLRSLYIVSLQDCWLGALTVVIWQPCQSLLKAPYFVVLVWFCLSLLSLEIFV